MKLDCLFPLPDKVKENSEIVEISQEEKQEIIEYIKDKFREEEDGTKKNDQSEGY